MRKTNRKFIAPEILHALIVITALATVISPLRAETTTDHAGNATTKDADDKYGPGGSKVTNSDKKFRVTSTYHYDKCGRLRELYTNDFDKEFPPKTTYYDSTEGNPKVTVTRTKNGDVYEKNTGVGKSEKVDAKEGKALVEKWEKTVSAPCPDKAVAPGPPQKPKPHPNPLGKILQGVNIGVGVSGGRTVGHDDNKGDHQVTDRQRTSSQTKKLPAGCKCHPCTCSPCRCGG